MQNSNKIFRLEGVVQHYAWGGKEFIPALLNQPNKEAKPYAEYWMGAHVNAPAKIELNNGSKEHLNELILKDPNSTLGEKVYNEFGALPYLLKILDVKDMLSIQVHPDKESARKAFEEENNNGIPLNAPTRNYKDPNHKPELMMALSDFWLLHGFKEKEKLFETLKSIPELKFLIEVFNSSGYAGLYNHVMEMPQPEVDQILKPLLERIVPLYKANNLNRSQEDFWAARAAITFNSHSNIDRGIFSIYFFNLVHCKPGEAVFQKAGLPHAYLEGQNVEIMSNSDNVLRGGLTRKHIDVQELMKHIEFEGMVPDILPGKNRNGIEKVYETPALDFQLSHFELEDKKPASFSTSTADILFVEKGIVTIGNAQNSLNLKKGEAAIVFNNTKVHLSANEQASVYRATVPIDSGE